MQREREATTKCPISVTQHRTQPTARNTQNAKQCAALPSPPASPRPFTFLWLLGDAPGAAQRSRAPPDKGQQSCRTIFNEEISNSLLHLSICTALTIAGRRPGSPVISIPPWWCSFGLPLIIGSQANAKIVTCHALHDGFAKPKEEKKQEEEKWKRDAVCGCAMPPRVPREPRNRKPQNRQTPKSDRIFARALSRHR